jgi:Tfp pilus assembly protein PilO
MTMSQATKTIIGFGVVAGLAIAFWLLLLAPKREEASRLSKVESGLEAEANAEQAKVAAGTAAKREFPRAYRELIVLGKAVPQDAETASLLVQLNQLGQDAHTRFQAIALSTEGGGSPEAAPEAAEASSARLPIGAQAGPGGLAVMPYQLNFTGGFFEVANFIHELDSQVTTTAGKIDAEGRLMTINGFELTPQGGKLASELEAEFIVTTYLAPVERSLTGVPAPASVEGSAP